MGGVARLSAHRLLINRSPSVAKVFDQRFSQRLKSGLQAPVIPMVTAEVGTKLSQCLSNASESFVFISNSIILIPFSVSFEMLHLSHPQAQETSPITCVAAFAQAG